MTTAATSKTVGSAPTMGVSKISAAESIMGVMREVSAVGKDGVNQAQNFKFRGIDAVMNAVGPALRKVGGFIKPDVLDVSYEHGTTKNGSGTIEIKLRVRYSWFGTDGGDPVTSEVISEAVDTSDKATAKALSVAYRTFLLQVLCLPTDDRDPDEDYHERAAVVTKQTPIAPAKASRDWGSIADAATSLDELRLVYTEAEKAGELSVPIGEGTLRDLLWALRKEMEEAK